MRLCSNQAQFKREGREKKRKSRFGPHKRLHPRYAVDVPVQLCALQAEAGAPAVMQGFLDEDMGPVELIGIPHLLRNGPNQNVQAAASRSILIIFSWAETERL